MPFDLTEQQRRAVDHRAGSVVLASGAGCGKTHVLTARYLSHLAVDNAEVGQVVAITFTERAAREMRKRVREGVSAKVASLQVASRKSQTAEGLVPDSGLADLRLEAERWRKHLRGLETAPVTTIHSFCGTLLRQHAVAVGLDPRFDVLDDATAAPIRADALRDSLHRMLEADPTSTPAADLRELVILFGWQAVKEAVDALVLDADRPAWAAFLARRPADIAADWLGPRRKALLPAWVAYLCAATPKVAHGLALMGRVTPPGAQAAGVAARLRDEVPRLHEAADLAAAVGELADLAKVGRTGKKEWGEEHYEAVKDALADLRGDLARRFALWTNEAGDVAASARAGQQFIRVAAAAHDAYQLKKRKAAALDFQDLLVGARDLLRDHPRVRDDLRKRFRHVLLDELQDTDPVQMELVGLLCGDGLTGGKLFAVGDHKQSIYRFRGADVGLFRALRQSMTADGRQGLTRNYRSQPGVLRFVNALFSKRVPDYEPIHAAHEGVGHEPNVEFLWSEPDGPAGEKESAGDTRRREAEAIAARVAALLLDPTPRVKVKRGPPRRVVAADVTLLFRSMSNVALYEAALRRHGLDYYLVGGRAFFAQQEVYDLLNLLRAVENPQDGACLVGALRSPFCNLSDEAIHLIAVHADGPWAGLCDPETLSRLPADQRPHAERARRHLDRWRGLKDTLPVARLLGAVFADSGYDAAMQFEFLGDRKLANLWKLTDLARGFDRTGHFGLHEFAARLADLVTRQPREEQAATLPENADVVKLMSIHQSKGLEFPVVVVPDLAAPSRGNVHPVARWDRDLGCLVRPPSEFETHKEEAPFPPFADELGKTADRLADWQEDLRVLYVACTRAEDLLILSAGLPEPFPAAVAGLPTPFPAKAANHWTLALAERFDPRTGRCVADDVKADDVPRVRVTFAGPAGEVVGREGVGGLERNPGDGRPWALPAPSLPAVVALPALERLARGETPASLGPAADTEDDGDRASWRTPREGLGPVSPADRVLWAVLDRWPFADLDAWADLLADALEDVPDAADARRIGDDLRAKLRTFAGSDARHRLAGAHELRRSVEFLADVAAFAGGDPFPAVRGVIDFLYRDAFGWHLLAVDLGTADEDDPWRGRRPGLVLQAWAASEALGAWPSSVELWDFAAGQLVDGDPRKVKPAAVGDHFRRVLDKVTR